MPENNAAGNECGELFPAGENPKTVGAGSGAGPDITTFESELARLEEIVEKMETGGLSLADSLALYEEGAKKIECLNELLGSVRDRVMRLITSEDEQCLEPFGGEESG